MPPGGFPPLQAAVLKGRAPISGRPGASFAPCDFEAEREKLAAKLGTTADKVADTDLMSAIMYPKVFLDYKAQIARFGARSEQRAKRPRRSASAARRGAPAARTRAPLPVSVELTQPSRGFSRCPARSLPRCRLALCLALSRSLALALASSVAAQAR